MEGERAHYELARGEDVRERIASYEAFASGGGMLPEQVWDGSDLPEESLYCGRPAGSAMPLVWAHAEYIKLLRSAADGKVFDLISVVEERYAKGDPKGLRHDIEMFKMRRHAASVPAGGVLRILNGNPFHVTWSQDGWKTVRQKEAASVGAAGWFCDLEAPDGQEDAIVFTLYWPLEQRWEGENFTVPVRPASK